MNYLQSYIEFIANCLTIWLHLDFVTKFVFPIVVICLVFKIIYSFAGIWKHED